MKHHDINKITINAMHVSTSAWCIYGPVLPHLSLYCLMDQDADRKRHEACKTLSQNILQKAREEASKKAKYDSVKMRADVCKLFSERESRFSPREWQLDVAEALLLGIDTVVIAGTGSGKTIPFMLPLVLNHEKMVLTISPLKVLQRDQVCPSAV
jgi:ATP-dependent helicase YprA (DUF1998 family)